MLSQGLCVYLKHLIVGQHKDIVSAKTFTKASSSYPLSQLHPENRKKVKGGSEVVKAMKVPSSVQVLKVSWTKYNGFIYHQHLVICGAVKFEMPL